VDLDSTPHYANLKKRRRCGVGFEKGSNIKMPNLKK
jgi:hypothetical protein